MFFVLYCLLFWILRFVLFLYFYFSLSELDVFCTFDRRKLQLIILYFIFYIPLLYNHSSVFLIAFTAFLSVSICLLIELLKKRDVFSFLTYSFQALISEGDPKKLKQQDQSMEEGKSLFILWFLSCFLSSLFFSR